MKNNVQVLQIHIHYFPASAEVDTVRSPKKVERSHVFLLFSHTSSGLFFNLRANEFVGLKGKITVEFTLSPVFLFQFNKILS